MIGLGTILIGLAAGLGKYLSPNAGVDELEEEFCTRRDALADEIDPLDELLTEGPERDWSPCMIRFRQARLRAEDRLQDLRGVTRHKNWPLAIKRLNPARNEPYCHGSYESEHMIRRMHEYDELFRDWECPMVWTEDQG